MSENSFRDDGLGLGEILLRKTRLEAEQLEQARRRQSESGERLADILVEEGMLSPDEVRSALASQMGLPLRDNLDPDEIVQWAGAPLAVIDCFGILNDEQIKRYFELGCEVKALGRGHIQRIKEAVRSQK